MNLNTRIKAAATNSPEQRRGFTLIELLVVIAIIGILSSVVLASVSSARKSAKEANILQNLSSAQTQAELYYNANGSYTGLCSNEDIQDIVVGLSGTAEGSSCFVAASGDQYISSTEADVLSPIDFGIAATYDDDYYAVSPQGAVAFDEEYYINETYSEDPRATDWDSAKSICGDAGKRLPTTSELRAIYEIDADSDGDGWNDLNSAGFEKFNWSAIELPSQTTHAYRVYLPGGGVKAEDKANLNKVICVN